MQKRYDFNSSQADRANFSEMIEKVTYWMLKSISDEEAAKQDPVEYAELVWENTEIDIEYGNLEVDDIDEAKARTLAAAKTAVEDYQAELAKQE